MPELARVITADCSYPKEIDDAISVERVDENFEAYKVSVCVADTSGLYADQSIVEEAHRTTTAKYWDLPNGERGYDPMIDTDAIRDLELIEHKERSALVVSFIVGTQLAPSNVEIGFEQITIRRNLNYKEFSNFAHGPGQRFVRASKLIKQQLNYVAYGDHVGERPVWRGRDDPVKNMSEGAWKRGSKINESFMVATNHLVGKLFAEEGRPAIYRVHDPDDERHLELLSPNVAWYSRTPGPHTGLNLEPYCRVTSPLRRLDDFVMNRQLKQRFLGKEPTAQDIKQVAFAVRRLNQEIVAAAPKEASRYSKRDILGKEAGSRAIIAAVG